MKYKKLNLTLYRRWFDSIASGEKREEYRLRTLYWTKKLEENNYEEIHFRNGYRKDSPWMRVESRGITTGEWQGQPCYVIKLGKILEIRNYENHSTGQLAVQSTDDSQAQPSISYAAANGESESLHAA